jgi:hypothetical protein
VKKHEKNTFPTQHFHSEQENKRAEAKTTNRKHRSTQRIDSGRKQKRGKQAALFDQIRVARAHLEKHGTWFGLGI